MKVYIDIPEEVPPSHPIAEMRRQLVNMFQIPKVEITSNAFEAAYVVKPLGSRTNVSPERQIVVRDFSFPQTVPKGAICLDFKKRTVLIFDEKNSEISYIPLGYYVKEFLMDGQHDSLL